MALLLMCQTTVCKEGHQASNILHQRPHVHARSCHCYCSLNMFICKQARLNFSSYHLSSINSTAFMSRVLQCRNAQLQLWSNLVKPNLARRQTTVKRYKILLPRFCATRSTIRRSNQHLVACLHYSYRTKPIERKPEFSDISKFSVALN